MLIGSLPVGPQQHRLAGEQFDQALEQRRQLAVGQGAPVDHGGAVFHHVQDDFTRQALFDLGGGRGGELDIQFRFPLREDLAHDRVAEQDEQEIHHRRNLEGDGIGLVAPAEVHLPLLLKSRFITWPEDTSSSAINRAARFRKTA